MEVKTEFEEGTLTAYLVGEIDHHSASELRQEIDSAIVKYTPEVLILDFKEVGFSDSSGVGLVMGRYKQMHALGGRLEIRHLNETMSKIMKLSGITEILDKEKDD